MRGLLPAQGERLRVITLLAGLAIAASILGGAAPAAGHAPTAAIRVVSSDHEIRFPSEIVFKLIAEASAPITQVTLYYRLSGGDVRIYGYPDFTAGTRVTADFSLKTGGANHLPPGVDVEYHYEIVDSDGNVMATPTATIEYKDTRFSWRRVETGNLTVLYHDLPTPRVESVAGRVAARLEEVKATFGLESAPPLKAVLVNGRHEARQAFPFVSGAATRGHFFGGFAYDEFDLFVLAGLWEDGMVHELAHLLLDEAVSSPMGIVPDWLNEGLATYFERGAGDGPLLLRAAKNGDLLRLHGMNSVPGRPHDIALFYEQSRSIVEHMLSAYGREKMTALLSAIDDGLGIDSALRRVYGFERGGLEAKWAARYGVILPERAVVEQRTPRHAETAVDAPLVFESPLKTEPPVPAAPAAAEPAPSAAEAPAPQSASRAEPLNAVGLTAGAALLAALAASVAVGAAVARRRRAR